MTMKYTWRGNKNVKSIRIVRAEFGAASKALERLGIEHEIVDAVEIDKYAITSFNAIHGTNFDVQDITMWDKDLDVDLIMHGSPCQDFSVAGKQAGGDVGSGTRSSLMYETIRIVAKLRPKYVVWENVKNLLSKKHKHNFDAYIETMNILGYNSYYQVLNAKDYGIPQNRERVFTISIKKDVLVYDDYNSNIRKDQDTIGTLTTNCGSSANRNGWKIIETNQSFQFPEKEPLKLRLKDMLEKQVDEKYYLSDKMIAGFTKHNENHIEKGTGFIWKPKNENDIASTLRANASLCPTDNTINVGEVTPNSQAGQVYSDEGISPTLTAGTHGYAMGNILESKKTNSNVIGHLEMDKWQDYMKRIYDVNSYAPTLGTMQGGNTEPKVAIIDDTYANRDPRVYDEYSPALRSERIGLKVVEPQDSILVKNATKKGYDEAIDGDSVNLSYPESTTRRGRVGHGVSQTLQCNDSMGVVEKEYERTPLKFLNRNQKNIDGDYAFCVDSCSTNGVKEIEGSNLRIRKLTPKECWRLMGFDDEDFEKARNALNEKFYKGKDKSSSQLYKQAGNSIVVNVLEKIFKNLLEE